jgi:hypothetical protein
MVEGVCWDCPDSGSIEKFLTIGKNQTAESETQDELITWMEGAYTEVKRVVAESKDRERKICMEWEKVVSQQSRTC